MTPLLAVDLGTARTLVAVPGRGVIIDEPTIAAVDLGRNRLVAFGSDAVGLSGRCAGEVAIVRPVHHGQLFDLDLTAEVVRDLLRRGRISSMAHPTVLCCASAARQVYSDGRSTGRSRRRGRGRSVLWSSRSRRRSAPG